jgi:hypothetical protein
LRDKIVYYGRKGLDPGSFSGGKMYDETSRLCMEHAQDDMISEGNLEWKSIDEDSQVLVSKQEFFFSKAYSKNLTTGMEPKRGNRLCPRGVTSE